LVLLFTEKFLQFGLSTPDRGTPLVNMPYRMSRHDQNPWNHLPFTSDNEYFYIYINLIEKPLLESGDTGNLLIFPETSIPKMQGPELYGWFLLPAW